MSVSERWLLPDGVDELLPPEAWVVEQMRRSMLDAYASYGYELVSPPLIEYIESLLTGTGNDLDLQTFKVTDQLTGRMMGVRADITPQVARIDTHLLKSKGISRLCYVDTVLHTRPAHTLTNRSPLQIGCELFGEAGSSADIEIISLMLNTLELAGVQQIHIDLAHVGIYRGLVESADMTSDVESQLFDALSRKSLPDLDALAVAADNDCSKLSSKNDAVVIRLVRDIANLSGGVEALVQIRSKVEALSLLLPSVVNAIEELQVITLQIQKRFSNVQIGFDFCELRGYNYHTGILFSAFSTNYGHALAKGGRYNDIGKDFGKSRPATGFSADLKSLVRLVEKSRIDSVVKPIGVLAPAGDEVSLLDKIAELRKKQRVVQQLSDHDIHESYNCNKRLVLKNNEWHLKDL
ncbi:MAG: ATP phosphoribosyltransferase regulatory subunit [Oleiphilaceae bacterium]|jgi:ATP phosphoribosyltransferase regulatory subunit